VKNVRELALFNLAIDSKLRGCDLLQIRVKDVLHGGLIVHRGTVMQRKTGHPVQFEITRKTRVAIYELISRNSLTNEDYLFQIRVGAFGHL